MRVMLPLMALGVALPAPAAHGQAHGGAAVEAGETSVWMRAPDLTSASLAAATLPPVPFSDSAAWGLVSGSAHAPPDGRTRLVTFWRWMHPTLLDGDMLYRCVDVIDGRGETVEAVCLRPQLPARD